MIKRITAENLNELAQQATAAARRRTHLNVHASIDAAVQRLFIATQPDTYIRPHRHPQTNKWEFFMVLGGAIDLLIFDEAGQLMQRTPMSPTTTRAVEIPPNTWHAYVCMAANTLALEVKEGPYIPTAAEDFSAWSPAENSEEAKNYHSWMRTVQAR